MNLDPKHIKIFPAYEDVFMGDIQMYKKHFLPICSLNLKSIYPDQDQWLHFVSVHEIFDGCVGDLTQQYHTEYTKRDMLGFNVVGNKYEFEADWKYFIHEQHKNQVVVSNKQVVIAFAKVLSELEDLNMLENWITDQGAKITPQMANTLRSKFRFLKKSEDPDFVKQSLKRMEKQAQEEDLNTLAGAYQLNQKTYEVVKEYYQKHGQIYPFAPGNYSDKVSTLAELEQRVDQDSEQEDFPEFFGILDDIKFTSQQQQELIKEFDIDLHEMIRFEDTNLMEKPYDLDGQIFEYIGFFTGYLFQAFGSDRAYLFYNKELKKAVMCLEYT